MCLPTICHRETRNQAQGLATVREHAAVPTWAGGSSEVLVSIGTIGKSSFLSSLSLQWNSFGENAIWRLVPSSKVNQYSCSCPKAESGNLSGAN